MSEVTPKLADFDPRVIDRISGDPAVAHLGSPRGGGGEGLSFVRRTFWVTPNSDILDIWGRSEHLGTGGEIFVESKQRKYTLDEMFLPGKVRQQIG